MMKGIHILIVEDELIIASDIKRILEEAGCSVAGIVSSGEEAIKRAAAAEPDLVLMDIMLQGDIDGVTTAMMIRERLAIPVVYLTAHSDSATLSRAMTAEPYGYILKPVEEKILLLTIELALYKHRLDMEVKKSELRFRTIADNMLDMVTQVDVRGVVQYASPSMKTILGYDPAELVGKPSFDYIHPEDVERLKPGFTAVQKFKSPTSVEFRCRRADGRWIWVESLGNNLLDDSGRVVGRVYGARDITERKRMEEVLQSSEARYRELFDNANDVIYTHDLDGNFTSFNRKAVEVTGYSREEGLAMNVGDIIAPGYDDMARGMIDRKIIDGGPVTYELEIVTKDGRRVLLEVSTRLIYGDGVPVEVQGIARDITGQRRVAEALRFSEEKFATAFQCSPVAMTLTNIEDTRFVEANESFLVRLGFTREEVIGRTVPELDFLENPADEDAIRDELISNGKIRDREFRFRTKGGEVITGLYSADIVTIVDRQYVLTGVIDITERKRLESQREEALSALRESEARLRFITEYAHDAIWIRDMDLRVVYISPSVERMLGYAPAEIALMRLEDHMTPASFDRGMRAFNEVLALERSGRNVGPLSRTLELEFLHKNGSTVWVEQQMSFLRGAGGEAVGIIGVGRDITERRRAEDGIRKALEEKDLLMKEILHRVKNNMSVIYSLLGYQAQSMGDPRLSAALEESRNRILTIMKVNEKLYHSDDLTSIDLSRYITDLATSLFDSYNVRPGRITLDVRAEHAPLDIKRAIPCGLIINELITNSLKHAFPGERQGRIEVRLRREERREGGEEIPRNTIVIRDDGIGIPAELDWRNTASMGLQLVTMLVEQLDGGIELDRVSGTEFTIRF